MIGVLLSLAIGVALGRGKDTERTVDAAIPLSDIRVVVVAHSQGELSILPTPAGQPARAELRLGASGSGSLAEKAFLRDFRLSLETVDGRLVVRTEMPVPESKPPELSFVASLRLWLPRDLPVEAENLYGRLHVEGRDARVQARSRLGPLEIRGVRGDLELSVDYDHAHIEDIVGNVHLEANSEEVVVRQVQGTVTIVNKFGEVRVEDVQGRAKIENRKGSTRVTRVRDGVDLTSPFGAVIGRELGGASVIRSNTSRIELERCPGSVTVEHRHGEVVLRSIGGDVEVTGAFIPTTIRDLGGNLRLITTESDLDVAGVAGVAEIEGQTGSIRIRDVRGNLEAHGQGGLLEVVYPTWPDSVSTIVLENRSSPLELYLPDDADVALELRSTLGVVESRFPGLTVRKDGQIATGEQTLGSGRSKARATSVGAVLQVLRSTERDEKK